MMPLITEQLITDCIKGKRVAQKRFYEHYHPKMLSVCMRYTINRDDALEIMNQGFLKVFDNLNRIQESNYNLDGWIYRIMVNTSIDHIRKEMKHRFTDEISPSLGSAVDDDALSNMRADEIILLISKLPPAYKLVFNLYAIEGMTHREIAEKLGVSEGTSKSNLAKARAKLKVMIREQEEFDLLDNTGERYG